MKLPLALLALVSGICAASSQESKSEWLSSGATARLGFYMPRRLELKAAPPESLKKAPADLSAPLYGELQLGADASKRTFLVVVDEPEGKPARLFIDANRNGDLTDDALPEWKARPQAAGSKLTTYMGNFDVRLAGIKADQNARINAYRFDKSDPQRAALKNTLLYYADYAVAGTISLSGNQYSMVLPDLAGSGDFRGGSAPGAQPGRLFIDLNADGRYDMQRESFDVKKPFNIGGTTWEVANLAADGTFQIAKSSQTVPETKPAPNLSAGQKVLSFEAKTTEGKSVRFPEDYKGKVVLLDFWATWCGPCVAELPNVISNYKKFHSQGLEILSISLDKEGDGEKLANFTKGHDMPWPQVFDGKFWQAEIAQLYNIQSIPAMFLVDGTTGKILGSGNEIRGKDLEPAITKALQDLKK